MIALYNYWIVIFLMMTGFYIVIARENLIKTIIGLNIFQTSVFLLYITMGKVAGGTAQIIQPVNGGESHHDASVSAIDGLAQTVGHDETGHASEAVQHAADHAAGHVSTVIDTGAKLAESHPAVYHGVTYSNPLPSVLMLTAIVVGIATTALALALIVRIREEYGTIEEDEILLIDREEEIC